MTTPRVRHLPGGRVRPGALAPVVVALVLGILGMHGISAHGANLHGPLTRAAAATPVAAVMADHEPVAGAVHSDDAHPDGTPSSGAPGHPAGHADGPGGMGGLGGVALMCAAMLAGAALALLTLLVRRGRLPQVWASLSPAGRLRVAVPAVLRVGTGPPAVWRFSVIRC